jgi:PPOX class probable F420-dependent enzyme
VSVLPVADAWGRVAVARVARLATVGPDNTPHVVPCCFALDDLVAYSAVDDKPKRTARLRRLADVEDRPVATLLIDEYDEDWTRLWWIRVGGPASVIKSGPVHDRAIRLLLGKYPQYFGHRLDGPVLAVELINWRTWEAGQAGEVGPPTQPG